jgi:hypothetical protein
MHSLAVIKIHTYMGKILVSIELALKWAEFVGRSDPSCTYLRSKYFVKDRSRS